METLDWNDLADKVVPKPGKVLYSENKHRFTKVAFDVFRMNDSPIESLWILEDGDDGKQYLVARYDDQEEGQLEAKSSWMALLDKKAENVTLFYNDYPIQRFASLDYGFGPHDAHIFQRMLVDKLNADKSFVEKLMSNQSDEHRKNITERFPELNGGSND